MLQFYEEEEKNTLGKPEMCYCFQLWFDYVWDEKNEFFFKIQAEFKDEKKYQ